jgi:competence protein ComEA
MRFFMSHASATPLRRFVSLLVPPLALVILVLIGRNVTNAAPPLVEQGVADVASAPTAAASTLAVASTADGGAPSSPAADAAPAVTSDVARAATELLGDGAVIVDLNLAAEDDLRKLPGIGATRARAILALRARLGRFKSVDELARIKGLGRGMIKRLRPRVRVTPAP